MTGSSTQGIKTVLHPVSDLATAKAVYEALLGVPPQFDGSYYVGFETAGQHIGLVPGGGPQGMTSPVAYWHVPDLEAKLAEVTAAGATVKEAATTSAAAAWWPPSPDRDGKCSGLLQDPEHRRAAPEHRRDTEIGSPTTGPPIGLTPSAGTPGAATRCNEECPTTRRDEAPIPPSHGTGAPLCCPRSESLGEWHRGARRAICCRNARSDCGLPAPVRPARTPAGQPPARPSDEVVDPSRGR